MNIEERIKQQALDAIKNLYDSVLEAEKIQIQQTKKEFTGDFTIVMFPLLKISKKNPEETGKDIGMYIQRECNLVESFNVIKGFLNISIRRSFWLSQLNEFLATNHFGHKPITAQSRTIMVEYSSPNTNKPLHLGHIRNNLLGYSIAKILEANGYNVIKANLVNDRGIHICKSMIAWKLFGNNENPQSSGLKGDSLVGKYYVMFDKAFKKQVEELKTTGLTEDEAKDKAPIMQQAREMLRLWEANDPDTISLWNMMNEWVYAGFNLSTRCITIPKHTCLARVSSRKACKTKYYTQKTTVRYGATLQPTGSTRNYSCAPTGPPCI
jgi:arginyl-tRNA synthetase